MKKVLFKKWVFLTSALKMEELPKSALPEMAIVGRSNVGKSSLINHLLRSKHVAKVSSRPGKTERINFFVIDDALMIADLPGYGYASVSKKVQREWGTGVDQYLQRGTVRLLLFLIDARRQLVMGDQQLLEWADHAKIPVLIVLTKADKLSQVERETLVTQIRQEKLLSGLPTVLYSTKEEMGRGAVISEVNKLLWG